MDEVTVERPAAQAASPLTTTTLATLVREAITTNANVPGLSGATQPTDSSNHEGGYSGFLMTLADGKSYWVVVCPVPAEGQH